MRSSNSPAPTGSMRSALKGGFHQMSTLFGRRKPREPSTSSQSTTTRVSIGTQTTAEGPRDGEEVIRWCPCPPIMDKPSSDSLWSPADRTAMFVQSVPSVEHAGQPIALVSKFDLEDDISRWEVNVKYGPLAISPSSSGEKPQPSAIGFSSVATPEGISLRTSVAGTWYRNATAEHCESNGVPGVGYSYRAEDNPLEVDVRRYPKPKSASGKWSANTRPVDSVFQVGVLPDGGNWRPFVRDYWPSESSEINVSCSREMLIPVLSADGRIGGPTCPWRLCQVGR